MALFVGVRAGLGAVAFRYLADDAGRYLGILAVHDVMDALAAGEATDVTALTRGLEPLPRDASLGQVLRVLDQGADAVPIADIDGAIVGWVRHRDVLAALISPEPIIASGHNAHAR